MVKKFVELVFDCPFILLKGFLRGLITCKREEVEYFFPKLAGIESETLKESLKEWLGLESHVHLFIEEVFAEYLKEAIKKNYDRLKIKVVSEKKIKEAYFSFSFAFFEEKALAEFKNTIKKAINECERCGIEFEKSEGYEPLTDDFGGGLTPVISAKRYFLNGKVQGYLPSVVSLRERISKNKIGDISKIGLVFVE